MKLTRQLLTIGFALFVSTVLASAIPGRAEVKKVVGQATVAKAAGGSASITAGMVLGTGDTITTGAGSTVDLDLGINGDFLRVDPDTTLKIDNLDIANVSERTVTTQLNIAKGGMTGNVVNKLTAASKYEIKSASGVAGIRGTVYSVKTDANGRITRIVVTSGRVTFSQGGVSVTITAGQALTPPPAGTALTQASVGVATPRETAQTHVGVYGSENGRRVAESIVGTAIKNPLNVSISQ